ncbi:tyrosine-type recombinase/integrase [Halobacterium rubrum]|uniref:tyrosine-type recombinase/integrase n=1 Tax=Halobacterium TaxID=2239 RepID=UPI001F3F166C|nr:MULTISPECIES: tyrosine-type recombinase/integrase [Halobacterium]MDH5020364.1 tyrosine-type recombinase/integrase [Halobacterium rubrum]
MARFVEFLYNRDKCVSSAELADVDRFFVELCWIDITDSTFLTYRKNICNLFHHIELYREEEAETSRALIIDAIDPSDYETEEGFERRALTAKQLKKFLNAVTSRRNLLIIRIAVEVGPRNRDIAKLKIDDVDLENQRVNITNTKSGGNYSGYIPSELTMLLRRWIEIERPSLGVEDSNEYLFPSQKGGRLGVNQIGRIVHKAADRAGIQREIDKIPLSERQKEIWGTDKDYRSVYRVDVHTLRHTFNELLAKSGVSREARSFALDHSTTEVTKEHYDEARERHWNEIEEKFSGLPDFID